MRFLRTQSIRRQVALSTMVLITPLVVGAIWSSSRTRRERRAEVRDQAQSIATASAAYVSQYVRGLDSLAFTLAQHPAVVALNREECDRLLARALHDQPMLLNISLHAPDATIKGTGIPTTDVKPRMQLPHIRQVVESGQPLVTDLTVGGVSHKPTVLLAYPVRSTGGPVVGVLQFGLDLEHLQSMFAAIPLPEGSIVTLTNGAGLVLARSRDAERFIGTTVEGPRGPLSAGEREAWNEGPFTPDQPIAAAAPVERGGWVINVGIPAAVVSARLLPLFQRNLAISLAATLSSLALSLWFGGHLARQLNHFKTAAQRISQGDLSPFASKGAMNREFTQLQDEFSRMAASLRDTRAALAQQLEHERKIREMVESLQRQVVRQERLAAVGVLVSGVAHELNNPLQAIVGAAELLERRSEMSPEAMQEIGFVKTQSSRASEIIRNLSRFGSQQPGPPAVVDLRDIIGEVAQLRRADLVAAQISFDIQLLSSRKVYANFTEIEQVILNFVINAQQALQSAGTPNGRIIIRLSDVDKRVRLEVIDNGPGVRQGDQPKLFQPFFTTKDVGEGTGLGLSVSYGIIDSYGGAIGHQENQLGGATFFFELPAMDSPPVSA